MFGFMIAAQKEGYEGEYECVLHNKPSAYLTLKNMLSKYLKQMSKQDVLDLNDELTREVQARLGKVPKAKEAGISDPQDLLQNLSSLLSSDKLLKSPLPRVSNFSQDPNKSTEVSFEHCNFEFSALRKNYHQDTIKEVIIRSLNGAAVDTVRFV